MATVMIYDVMIRSMGGTERKLIEDMALSEAVEFCEEHGWQWDDGGYIWDLFIDKRPVLY